jgi:serine O-acetyltransferase
MNDEDRKLSDPTNWPVHVYRFGRAVNRLPGPLRAIGSRIYGAAKLGLDLTLGTVLHRETEIGEGLFLVHPHNIKVHPRAVLGARVRLNHDVTIGMNPGSTGFPRIGNDVLIGAGAKILGAITIGDGAVIAANSLVISDIPAGQVAMGVPARPLPQRKSNVAPISGARSRRSQPPPPASGANK